MLYSISSTFSGRKMVLNEYLVYVKGKTGTREEFVYTLDKFKKLYTIKDLTTDLKTEAGVTKNETWKLCNSKGIEVKHLKDCSDGIMVLSLADKLPAINRRSKNLSVEESPRGLSLSTRNSTVKFPAISTSFDSDRARSDPSVRNSLTNRNSRSVTKKPLAPASSKSHLTVPDSEGNSKKTKTRSHSRSSSKSIKRNIEPVNKQGTTTTSKESLNEGLVKQCAIVKSIENERELYAKYDPGTRVGDGNFANVYKITLVNDHAQLYALKVNSCTVHLSLHRFKDFWRITFRKFLQNE